MSSLYLEYTGASCINGQKCGEPKCQTRFTSGEDAKRHMLNVHNVTVGFRCSKCNYEKPSVSGVSTHFLNCNGQIPPAVEVDKEHKCKHCERSFDSKIGLGQHFKNTHRQEHRKAAPLPTNYRVDSAEMDMVAECELIAIAEGDSADKSVYRRILKIIPDKFPALSYMNHQRLKYIRTKQKNYRSEYLEPRQRARENEATSSLVPSPKLDAPLPHKTRTDDELIDAVAQCAALVTVEGVRQGTRDYRDSESLIPTMPSNTDPPDKLAESLPVSCSQTPGQIHDGEEDPPEEHQPTQPPTVVAAAGENEDEPGGGPPLPPGGGPGGDPTPPSGPAPSDEIRPIDKYAEAIIAKALTITSYRTKNPLANDLNPILLKLTGLVRSRTGWNAEAKQEIFDSVEETLRRHRPRIFEEPPRRRTTPRRNDVTPIFRNRAARRKHRYAKAQRIFMRKPKDLMRRDILEEKGQEDTAYTPTTDDAFQTYNQRFGVESKREESDATPVGNSDLDPIWAPLCKKEIDIALRSMPNSAAGPTYSGFNKPALKSIGNLALHRIFLIWQLIEDIPDWCKDNRTILIPKKATPQSINDFRPLTIGSHISRLFTRALAARLTKHLPLHERQKAFRPVDGCGENLALIEGIIADARKRSKPLYIAFVDVAKAFDTVSHHSIGRALRRLRCPKPFVSLVENLYRNSTTRINVDGADTEVIQITNGVKQGCPLSPLLFNSVTDELLHLISEKRGYKLTDDCFIASMAFADDLILISSSRAGLESSLNTMSDFFQARGMRAQPKKCCTMGLKKTKGRGIVIDDAPFKLLDPDTNELKEMTTLGDEDWTRYLGLEIGSTGLKSGRKLREEGIATLTEELRHIHSLPLKANQKIHLLKTYTIPSLQYKWTKGPAALNMLRQADRLIAAKVRSWLKLFHSTPMAFFRIPISDGGLGIPSITELVVTGKVRLHAKLCSSTDRAVAYVAKTLLWGKEVKQYTKRFKDFELGGEMSGKNLSRILSDSHRNTLQLTAHCHGAELFRNDPLGNSIITDTTTDTGLVIDMIKLRTQTFPTRLTLEPTRRGLHVPFDPKCRKPGCHEPKESASHVLQECESVKGLRKKRHDLVDEQCTKWITDKGFLTAKEPKVVSSMDSNVYFPDRLFCHPGSDTLYVLDWTVPYETTTENLRSKEMAKETKYRPHRASILEKAKELFPGKTFQDVVFKGIAFGARGAIRPATREFLHRKMGMSKRCISWVQHRVAQRSIKMLKSFFSDGK